MEGSGNYHLLSKFTRLRKKPQQPLTDLTELYGKVANETIFYLKLEEQGNYKGALQGWKALNTDVMYSLTVIEHEYPNVQSYTREELNIKSGLRELYNKNVNHLERVKALYLKGQEKLQNRSGNVPQTKTRTALDNRSSSFNKRPTTLRGLSSNSSRKMATTLRGVALLPNRRGSAQSSQQDARTHTSKAQNNHRVNFTPSKPLAKPKTIPAEETVNFDGFDENVELIDLTQDSENEDQEDVKDYLSATSPKSDQFEFDVEDYYGDLLDESASEEDEKDINRLEKSITNLSINSPPLVPTTNISAPELPISKAPELPTPTLSDIMKDRPPIPTSLPPSLVQKSSVPIINLPKPETNGNKAKSPSGSSLDLCRSKTNTSSTAVTSKRNKLPLKSVQTSSLKSTKSTPSLPVKSKTSALSKTTSTSTITKTPQLASSAAKRVLVKKSDNMKKNTTKKLPQVAPNPTYKKAQFQKHTTERSSVKKTKKELNPEPPARRITGNSNEKANSMNSIISNSSVSSNNQRKEKTAPISKTPALSDESQEEMEPNGKELKEALEEEIIDSLQGVDKEAAKQIFAEIVVHGDEVHWEDIAGLESAKNSLKEAVVYPFLRPDLFRGLREPVRGMLLFGPPGTGKTMLARAVATESRSTFFSISASSLTSKYLGESEKLVRALFAVAKKLSPSIVFVDEIDSIMGSRNNDGENESSRRIKNEFLIQWSSLSSAAAGNSQEEDDERVLVLAATNLPWSIDEAARRRFVRRQYIPLPEPETRSAQLKKLLSYQKHTMTDEDFVELLHLTDGFSGSDLTSLAKDAAMGPLRELGDRLLSTPTELIRPINLSDFRNSLNYIKPSVSQEGLERYEDWAARFGSSGV